MNEIIIYSVKINIAIALFYLLYRFAFSNDTFWKLRRFYLLVTVLFSAVFPAIVIPAFFDKPQPIAKLIDNFMLPEFTVSPTANSEQLTFANILIIIYFGVVAVLFFKLVFQYFSILKIRKSGVIAYLNDQKVIKLSQEIAPFSFFKAIFINPELHSETELSQILAHEQTHVQQWHSVDVLISEFLCILFWFNPFIWLLKTEIRQNLEFLADNQVIKSGYDTKAYQFHLLQLSYQSPNLNLTNKFNILPLKKRIIMMNQQKTTNLAMLKYLLIAPLAVTLIFTANASKTIETIKTLTAESEKMNVTVSTVDNVVKTKTVKTELDEVVVVSYGNDDNQKKNTMVPPPPPPPTDENVTFQVVEKMPTFDGGDQALFKYLGSNVKYPVICAEKNIQGRVICSFVVEKDGSVGDIKTIRSVDPLLDAEAIRVIAAMPKWIPGEQRGEKVRVQYTLPINFRLDNGKTADQPKALIVVDGEVMPSSFNVNNLNAEKIEKIDVLKNEAATKIYGDKGKNGVIIISLKK